MNSTPLHRQKRSICCLVLRKEPTEGAETKTRCGCRAARLFDFTTDSWRSRVVVILVFITIYLNSANIILAYSGINPVQTNYDIKTASQCINYPFSVEELHQSAFYAQNSSNETPLPLVQDDGPTSTPILEWSLAFSVAIQVIGLIVGLSSRQHILVTAFSYILFAVFSVGTIKSGINGGGIDLVTIYSISSQPNSAECFYLFFPTIVRVFVEMIFSAAAIIAFSAYFISILAKRHDNGNYDDWRLHDFAYPYVRRLLTPLKRPPRSHSKKSCFDRILHTKFLQKEPRRHPFTDIQQQGLISSQQKLSNCQKIKNFFANLLRNTILFFVHLLQHAFTSPPPPPHSAFQRPADMIYSTRILTSLSTCIVIMLVIAATVHGNLLRVQGPLRQQLERIPLDSVVDFKNTTLYHLAEHVIDDLPLVSGIACAASFIVVLVISLLTLQTYRNWIFELRQGRKPFSPVLIGNGPFWASSFLGHQLSHFLLGFVTCVFTVVMGYLVLRVLIDVEFIREFVQHAAVKFSIPFLINFAIQFVLARIYTAWGGRDLRFKFTFQVVDIVNTTLSSLTTMLPSFIRLITHYSLNFLLAGRLDRPSLFVALDSAHHTFAGVVYQDHFNNNPIKLVFINEIMRLRDSDVLDKEELKRRRIARRWRLVILLAKYPSIRPLRKHALAQTRDDADASDIEQDYANDEENQRLSGRQRNYGAILD